VVLRTQTLSGTGLANPVKSGFRRVFSALLECPFPWGKAVARIVFSHEIATLLNLPV